MKKLFLMLLALTPAVACGNVDDKPIRFEQLPANAQQFVTQQLKGSTVALTTVDNDVFDKTYKVMFADGSKVEFDKNGEWEEMDFVSSHIPEAALPTQISDFIKENYRGQNATKIDRDKHDYELELTNRVELKFDLNFNLIEIDL